MFPAAARLPLQLRPAARYTGFWLAYLLLCWGGQQLTLAPEAGVALWPASGLFVAVLTRSVRAEWRHWLALGFSADLLASVYLFDFPLAVALPIAAGNALEASIGAFLLRRASGPDFRLQTTRDALAFTLFAGVLSPFGSMALGGTAVALHTGTPVLESWRLWWTGDAAGIVTVAPFLLAVGGEDWARTRTQKLVDGFDAAALLLASFALGYLCLGRPSPVTFFTLPLVIWAAIRYGVIGSTLVAALLVVQAVLYARAGAGPFATHLPLLASQTALQAFGIVTALTGLLLAVTLDETRRLKREAEEKVALRTAELRTRERQLESVLADLRQVDRRKDDFVAALAHEVLNPIAALSNGLALLDKNLPEGRTASVRTMMKRQLGLLTMLGSDLLELARIKSGKVHLQLRTNELAALIAGAVAAVQDRMAQKAQVLHLDLPATEIVLVCDDKRIIQVVTNLLGNAHRHCPPATEVHVTAREDASGVTIDVRDDGPGIAADQLARIFARYEQLDGMKNEGLGIGLALAKQIVELHGGRLDVRSEPGAGTTFTVWLPRVSGA